VIRFLPLAMAWLVGAFGGGAALAWLYKRLHPELAFYKLWALWTTVLGAVVALLLAFGFVRL
jgi:predicted lysophospholipase L1 biosynthesis ABC-type transport system permease subunit